MRHIFRLIDTKCCIRISGGGWFHTAIGFLKKKTILITCLDFGQGPFTFKIVRCFLFLKSIKVYYDSEWREKHVVWGVVHPPEKIKNCFILRKIGTIKQTPDVFRMPMASCLCTFFSTTGSKNLQYYFVLAFCEQLSS